MGEQMKIKIKKEIGYLIAAIISLALAVGVTIAWAIIV